MPIESVANEIIDRQGRLTAWKLQKLVFYANAIHLVRQGTPLFAEPIEAFKDGPVVRSLWERFRGLRWVTASSHLVETAPPLAGTELAAVEEALRLYGHQTPDWLRFQSHIEQPWIDGRAKKWPERKVITDDEIISFYKPVFLDPEVTGLIDQPLDDEGMTSADIASRYADHLS